MRSRWCEVDAISAHRDIPRRDLLPRRQRRAGGKVGEICNLAREDGRRRREGAERMLSGSVLRLDFQRRGAEAK